MTTFRKPRPDLIDRATVEAMIAAAVAAERARSERALAEAARAFGAPQTVAGIRTNPTMRKK